MNWKTRFTSDVLAQGVECFKSEKFVVRSVGNFYFNTKIDSNSVSLMFRNNQITRMDCDCHTARIGDNCHHMAALLYYLDNREFDTLSVKYHQIFNKNNEQISSLNQINQQIDSLICQTTDNLGNSQNGVSIFSDLQKDELTDIELYNKLIDDILSFISPEDKDSLPLINLINNKLLLTIDIVAGKMLANNLNELAFDFSSRAFLHIAKLSTTNDIVGLESSADACKFIWEQLTYQVDLSLDGKMFRWFWDHANDDVCQRMIIHIRNFLFKHFTHPDQLTTNLQLAKFNVTKCLKNHHREQADYWIKQVFKTMGKMNLKDTVINEYALNNIQLCSALVTYASNLDFEVSIDYANEIYCKFRPLFIDYPSDLLTISKSLISNYYEEKNYKPLVVELKEYIKTHSPGDLLAIKRLKSILPKDLWHLHRDDLLRNLEDTRAILNFLKEEALYSRLIELVKEDPSLYTALELEDVLKPIYPEVLLDKYQDFVMEYGLQTNNINQYYEIVELIECMLDYPNGWQRFHEIIHAFELTYANHPIMLWLLYDIKSKHTFQYEDDVWLV